MADQIKQTYSNKEEKSLYTNNVKRIDLIGTIKYVKKANKEKVNSKNIYST